MARVFSDAQIQIQAVESATCALTAAYSDHCTRQTQIELLITALHHYANYYGMTAQDWADILEEALGTYHADGGNDDGHFWEGPAPAATTTSPDDSGFNKTQ